MKNYNKLYNVDIFTNGLDAETGTPIINNFKLKNFSENILKKISVYKRSFIKTADYRVSRNYFFDMQEKNKTGWALILHKKDKRIGKELKKLIHYRKGKIIYYEDEQPYEFMNKYNGWDKEFKKLPYYLLIAGSPSAVPLKLQYLLDASRSVGRLFFYDIKRYRMYAEKVVSYKTVLPQKMLFFATAHNDDDPTAYSLKYMINPLIKNFIDNEYIVKSLLRNNATEKKFFNEINKKNYDIMFSATHGIGIKQKTADKKFLQGSIVCQDVKYNDNLLKNNRGLITGIDIDNGKSVKTKIWFMFACYSGGTLKQSDFSFWVPKYVSDDLKQYQAKKESFFGYLPQAALADPAGPYAIIAHIDPAWIFSFMDDERNSIRLLPFIKTLKRLMHKVTVVRSLRDFNSRYAAYSILLLNYVMDHLERGEKINPLTLSNLWVARQDAQNYILFGDPAFKL